MWRWAIPSKMRRKCAFWFAASFAELPWNFPEKLHIRWMYLCTTKLELAHIFREYLIILLVRNRQENFRKGVETWVWRSSQSRFITRTLMCVCVCVCLCYTMLYIALQYFGFHMNPHGSTHFGSTARAPSDRDQVVEVKGCKAGGPVQQHLEAPNIQDDQPSVVLNSAMGIAMFCILICFAHMTCWFFFCDVDG